MSQNEIKTGIKIEVQTNGTEQIKQLNQAIDDVPESLQKAREQAEKLKQVWQQDSANQNAKMAYVRAAGEVKQLEQSLQSLQTQTEQSGQSLDYFAKKAEKLQALNQDKQILGLDIDEQARQEIDKLNQSFIRLKESGTLSQKELARAADLHRDKIYRLEKSLSDLRPSLSDVADEVQTVVQKTAGLAYAANEAMKFETAMAAVKKVTEGSVQQYEQLADSLKELGGQLGIMPDQLAQIAAQGGQMGMSLEKLPEFTRMAAQMSVAFGITAEQAGEMAAKISNVFQLPMEDMARLSDAINTLGNTTAAKEAEISDVLMRIGGNAKQFGLAAEEAAALGAAFVSLGKTPEVAGTAINALLSKLQNAKLGNDEFKNSLKDLGLSAEEMAENIAANPQAALDDFLQRLQKLDAQARSETLGKLFGAEYSDDLALLVGSLKTYEDALATATDHEKTFGAMQKETEAALNTTAKQLDQAKAQIVSAAIDLGATLLPIIQGAAVAVGGIATTLRDLGQQFPILTQLAGLFLAAKAATAGFQVALRLMGLEGASSFLKTDLGAKKLKVSILETAAAAKVLGANIKAATIGNVNDIDLKTNAVKDLGSKLAGAAQNALALYSAFEVGHSIGTALREQSTFVRDLGDNLGKAYAYVATLWDGNTFDDVSKHYRTTRQEIREQEKAQREAAKAAQERAEKEKQAAAVQTEKISELTAIYRQQQREYNANERSLKTLSAAGKENSAMYVDLKEKNQALAQEMSKTKDELGKLNAKISDTSSLAKNRQALQDLGLTAEQVSTGISKAAKKGLDDFKLAAQGFGNDADSMAMVFQAAVKKMDSPEALAALKQSLVEAGRNAGLTAEQIQIIAANAGNVVLGLAQISKPLGEAETAAEKLGISLQTALMGNSPAFQAALTNFSAIRSQLDGLAENGVNVGVVLQQAFTKLTENAQTQADIEALKAQIQSLGEAGKLSGAELANALLAADVKMSEIAQATDPVAAAFRAMGVESRTATELQLRQAEAALRTIEQSGNATESALNQARNKVLELKNALDPTAQAFDRLGIKTKEVLAQAATQQMSDFERVRQSGQATQADLQRAFQQTAQAALASGDVSAMAWVQSHAAAYQYKVVVDETGKANLQAAAQTVQAAQTQVAAHNQVATAATQSAQAQSQVSSETQKTTQAIVSQGKALSELGQKVHYSLKQTGGYARLGTALWSDAIRHWQDFHINVHKTINNLNQETERGGDIAQWLSKATMMASGNVKALDKTTLNNLHQAIDKARQKMAQLAEEAKNARAEAEKELLSAQGRDDEVARLEQQRKINELRKKQQAAQKTGNREASADYEAAITASQRAFEERKRREAEQRERERMEAAQRETSTALPTPDVRVETNVNHLADLISAQNQQVANQAVKQFEQQLRDAIAMQN